MKVDFALQSIFFQFPTYVRNDKIHSLRRTNKIRKMLVMLTTALATFDLKIKNSRNNFPSYKRDLFWSSAKWDHSYFKVFFVKLLAPMKLMILELRISLNNSQRCVQSKKRRFTHTYCNFSIVK